MNRVSKIAYFEVVDQDGEVVCQEPKALDALLKLPPGGEIFEVVEVYIRSRDRLTITITKDVVYL